VVAQWSFSRGMERVNSSVSYTLFQTHINVNAPADIEAHAAAAADPNSNANSANAAAPTALVHRDEQTTDENEDVSYNEDDDA